MQQTATEVWQLVRSAGTKLAEHWPTLLALVFAGFIAKLATLKVALLAGEVFWPFGVLIYAFTAAGLLAAVMQMFRTMLPKQQWPPFTTVLAPFLVIYVASDHFDGYQSALVGERQVTMDVAAGAILILAIALRWTMPLWPGVQRRRWADWLRVGLDICWMSLVAFTIASHPLIVWIGGMAEPVSGLLEAAFTVLIVPLAWLAVGALAIGVRPIEAPDLLRRAGVPIVLATCLIVALLQTIPLLLWQIERLVIGAQDPQTFWQPVSGLLGAFNSAVGLLLVVCLVAAWIADSGGHKPGVVGQRGGAHDAYGDRLGVGGRHEEGGHLIGV